MASFGRRHVEGIAGLPFDRFDGTATLGDDDALVLTHDDGRVFRFPAGDPLHADLRVTLDADAAPVVALWWQPVAGLVQAVNRHDGTLLGTWTL